MFYLNIKSNNDTVYIALTQYFDKNIYPKPESYAFCILSNCRLMKN